MAPHDVRAFVELLLRRGLTYLQDGLAQDLVVVDQLKGPVVRCGWIEFGSLNLHGNPRTRVALCRLQGCEENVLALPDGWSFEESLSASPGFVPRGHFDQTLEFLRNEDGLEVYRNKETGKEIFIGRSFGKR